MANVITSVPSIGGDENEPPNELEFCIVVPFTERAIAEVVVVVPDNVDFPII
ncbi:hypothetical protein [Bacillus thuringiensis]|uniref:hypothetical protein n=1 Tax=Bacillus thuringiensis TaxID=1428 RepID=UPI0013C2E865|nr:hypothetical protein [Bacillus thuringiensis]